MDGEYVSHNVFDVIKWKPPLCIIFNITMISLLYPERVRITSNLTNISWEMIYLHIANIATCDMIVAYQNSS